MDVKGEPTNDNYCTVDTNLHDLPSEKRNTNIDNLSYMHQIGDGIQKNNDSILMHVKSEELDIKEENLIEPDYNGKDYADVSIFRKPLECDVYNESHKHHLQSHLQTCAGEEPFACNICKFKTADKRTIQLHMRVHTGTKLHKCNICGYRTSQKSTLATHLKTHTGEKPYACNFCEYRASQKSHLTIHLKTHTGKKSY